MGGAHAQHEITKNSSFCTGKKYDLSIYVLSKSIILSRDLAMPFSLKLYITAAATENLNFEATR